MSQKISPPLGSNDTSFSALLCKDSVQPILHRLHSSLQSFRFQSWYSSVFIALTCCLIVTASGCGVSPNSLTGSSAASALLAVSPNAVNFGNVPVGQAVSSKVSLVNSGSASVSVASLTVGSQTFSVSSQGNLPVTIAPGATYSVDIGFKPDGGAYYSGEFTAMDASAKPLAKASVSGVGLAANTSPQLTVDHASLNFGEVPVTTFSAMQQLTLTSTGTAPVTINRAALAGAGFIISGANFPLTLNPGQSTKLQLQFGPAATGAVTGSLTLYYTDDKTATVSLSGTGTPEPDSHLSVGSQSLDFGDVTVGASSTKNVTLISTGTAPVTLYWATPAGAGFSVPQVKSPITLNPGQYTTLPVTFTPASTEAATGSLTLYYSDHQVNVVSLSGTGTSAPSVFPELTINPTNLNFGDVTVGSSSTQPITLTSNGKGPLRINSVSVNGTEFSISGVSFPVTLNPHQSVTLQVRFTPTDTGSSSGNVAISSNSAANAMATVNLSGTGTPARSPQLSVSAASLNFGDVTLGSSSAQPLTLTSTGTAPVTIDTAAVTGSGFSITGATFPLTLNPRQAVTVHVHFSPATTGATRGHLTITSNSSTNPIAAISLNGTGAPATSPQLSLSAASLSFGDVTVGTSTTQSLTLTSTGTAPVTVNSANVTGTGFSVTGATFPLTLNPRQTATIEVRFIPGATGAVSGLLTIDSNSSTNTTATVNLSGTGTAAPSPQLSVKPASLSFGNVTAGTSSTQPLTLTSTGTAAVTIRSITVSGAEFGASQESLPLTLNPNQSVTLNVQFAPTATGAVTGSVTIHSNSSTNATTAVSLSGTGTAASSPQLSLSATSLSFGSETVGSPTTKSLTLTSTGTAAVTVNSAAVTGTGFTVSGESFPLTLNPGQAVTLEVRFDPTNVGAETGQLTIKSNSSTNATSTVSLSGTGAAAASPQLSISAASLSFGNVTVGSSSTQPLTLTSIGTAPVTISSAGITGTGFSVSGSTFPLTLNPQQSVTLHVRFTPATTGAESGTLTIESDSATSAAASVRLSGTGTAAPSPQLSISAASLSFGNVTVGSSSTQPLTLTSTGTAPVTVTSAVVSNTGFTVSGTAFPLALNPGQSVTLQVRFAPTATGTVSGTLTIDSDSATNAAASVSLRGTGAAAPSPQLSVSAASLSFGSVTLGSSSTQPLTLTSTGTAAVTVNSASITGTGFSISGATFPLTLNPQQSVTLQVKFQPANTGAVTGQLTIASNSSTNATVAVSLSGTGKAASSPQLSVSAASLSFGNVTVGSSSKQPLTLTSTGTIAAILNSLTLSGSGFSISPESFPLTLIPGQALTIEVEFSPTKTGPASSILTIGSNSSTNSNATVNLSGTGTAATSPQLSVSTASLSFGNVTVGSSATQSLTLTSTGTAPVTINAADVTGVDFTVSGESFPLTLNPQQSVTLQVQFSPTAAGAVTGQLTITSNSSTNATAAVNLSGSGVAAESHEVDLTWAAPTNSPVAVVGYHIYRATGTGSFGLLNSSLEATTAYVDTAVQSGVSYTYEVKSVDASGVESNPSNVATVTIP